MSIGIRAIEGISMEGIPQPIQPANYDFQDRFFAAKPKVLHAMINSRMQHVTFFEPNNENVMVHIFDPKTRWDHLYESAWEDIEEMVGNEQMEPIMYLQLMWAQHELS